MAHHVRGHRLTDHRTGLIEAGGFRVGHFRPPVTSARATSSQRRRTGQSWQMLRVVSAARSRREVAGTAAQARGHSIAAWPPQVPAADAHESLRESTLESTRPSACARSTDSVASAHDPRIPVTSASARDADLRLRPHRGDVRHLGGDLLRFRLPHVGGDPRALPGAHGCGPEGALADPAIRRVPHDATGGLPRTPRPATSLLGRVCRLKRNDPVGDLHPAGGARPAGGPALRRMAGRVLPRGRGARRARPASFAEPALPGVGDHLLRAQRHRHLDVLLRDARLLRRAAREGAPCARGRAGTVRTPPAQRSAPADCRAPQGRGHWHRGALRRRERVLRRPRRIH